MLFSEDMVKLAQADPSKETMPRQPQSETSVGSPVLVSAVQRQHMDTSCFETAA